MRGDAGVSVRRRARKALWTWRGSMRCRYYGGEGARGEKRGQKRERIGERREKRERKGREEEEKRKRREIPFPLSPLPPLTFRIHVPHPRTSLQGEGASFFADAFGGWLEPTEGEPRFTFIDTERKGFITWDQYRNHMGDRKAVEAAMTE